MGYRFNQINTKSFHDALPQINRNFQALDAEAVTKTFTGKGQKPSIIQGQLPNGMIGILLYSQTTGLPEILIGQSPDDGRMGVWQARPGEDVLDLLES